MADNEQVTTETEDAVVEEQGLETEVENLNEEELIQRLTQQTPQEKATKTKKPEQKEEKVEDISSIKAELEALRKKVTHQEDFIQRQGTEVGQLRKLRQSLLEAAEAKRKYAEDNYQISPVAAMDAHREAESAQEQARGLEFEEAVQTNRGMVLQKIPDFEQHIDTIVELAKEDGIPPAYIENFRRNPYATPFGIVLPYVQRAKERAKYGETTSLLEKLKKQVAELEAAPDKVVRGIKDATRKGPVITNAQPTGTRPQKRREDLDTSGIANLSLEELERLLKESQD